MELYVDETAGDSRTKRKLMIRTKLTAVALFLVGFSKP